MNGGWVGYLSYQGFVVTGTTVSSESSEKLGPVDLGPESEKKFHAFRRKIAACFVWRGGPFEHAEQRGSVQGTTAARLAVVQDLSALG